MKNYLCIGIMLTVFILTSCGNADPEIIGPKAKIYKTNGEYFNYLNTWGVDNGPIDLNFGARVKYENGDTLYNFRWQLANGYVLGIEISEADYFTNMTMKELVRYKELNPTELIFPRDSFINRVIDNDPFTEFWMAKENYEKYELPDSATIAELNEMIKNGELKNEFERLK